MEEIFKEHTEETAAEKPVEIPVTTKQTWKEWVWDG